MMDQHLINRAFSHFKNSKALVIGDVMLDAYYVGSVNRISPEAPVPVVQISSIEKRLGGAGNVVLNMKSLGSEVFLCSPTGNDENGRLLRETMLKQGLPLDGLVQDDARRTTVKTRIISRNQQMLRVDEETIEPLSSSQMEDLFKRIESVIMSHEIDVVVFEDYDKGSITKDLIFNVVELCRREGIPVAVDPKKDNFLNYKGVTLFKPNLKEVREGLNIDFNPSNRAELRKVHAQLTEIMNIEMLMLTLSEHGIFSKSSDEEEWAQAHIRNIADVSGAGDTVIATASLCIAAGLDLSFSTQLANIAGGLVCEKVGVVPVDALQLKSEAMKLAR